MDNSIDSNFLPKLRFSLLIGLRSGLVVSATVLGGVLVRNAVTALLDRSHRFDFVFALKFSLAVGFAVFLFSFFFTSVRLVLAFPADEILSEARNLQGSEEVSGFVAIQYYALILNRTFVVFICHEGVFGWKVKGPVAASDPNYFEPYKEMLKDPELMRSPATIHKLAQLRGGFHIPRSSIQSVEFNPRPKWGMSRIPHSGRIEILESSGKRTELILLGATDGGRIRDAILRGRFVQSNLAQQINA